jgi:membrane protease subunit HflC
VAGAKTRWTTTEAYRQAQEIKGRADAEAADVYASAYNKDPEFYQFHRTMEINRETFDENTLLLLTTGGDFLRYVGQAK